MKAVQQLCKKRINYQQKACTHGSKVHVDVSIWPNHAEKHSQTLKILKLSFQLVELGHLSSEAKNNVGTIILWKCQQAVGTPEVKFARSGRKNSNLESINAEPSTVLFGLVKLPQFHVSKDDWGVDLIQKPQVEANLWLAHLSGPVQGLLLILSGLTAAETKKNVQACSIHWHRVRSQRRES